MIISDQFVNNSYDIISLSLIRSPFSDVKFLTISDKNNSWPSIIFRHVYMPNLDFFGLPYKWRYIETYFPNCVIFDVTHASVYHKVGKQTMS